MVLQDLGPARINYQRFVAEAPAHDLDSVSAFLTEELPYLWLDAYSAIMPHRQNIQIVSVGEFEYLWDYSAALVRKGLVPANQVVEDRLVAAHGRSHRNAAARQDSRLRRRPIGPVEMDAGSGSGYDRGHAIGHALGGVLDLNIIPQIRPVNRGGAFRQMERYCLQNPGTYFFCRLLYAGLSPHPAEIEFGVLRADATLWVQSFKNYGDITELEKIERVYREWLESHSPGT